MIRRIAASVTLGALALPHSAQACLYAQRPGEVGYASGEYFAKEMLAAATYADLVLVQDGGPRAMDARPPGVITLRTIARFKGAGRVLNRLTMSDGKTSSPNYPTFGFMPAT